jgi:hypothetical protein
MQRRILATCIALALALPCVGAKAADNEIPFQGSMAGERVSLTPLAPPHVVAVVEITGNSTLLGEYDLVLTAVVNQVERSAVGTFHFVAANGDTLTADFVGRGTPSDVPGVTLQRETAVVTGGTGRFRGATGTFSTERLFDTVTLQTIGTFEGTISVPRP